ncbi:MAG: hypothetical protein A2283_12770 [Lentisphaerae bacterium RIFOXYA12_FULL_48_11]|nr:MAG: hypothetical protein A2283_12770 [Lentisphaerae bacterium RIFOXYA12_FULL_48_11]
MKSKISITAASDIAALVSRRAFMNNVDPDDLACRKSQEINDWYHADWFFRDNGNLFFIPPAFEFRNGHLLGINGRHRALLLSRHAEIFPMLLVLPMTWPQAKLQEIIYTLLADGQVVELPDLPMNGTINEIGEQGAEGDAVNRAP